MKKPSLFATISLSGVSKDGIFSTKVVPETDVSETKNCFHQITDEFVYSVHLEASSTWEEQVAQLDLKQFTQLLFDDSFVKKINGISRVCCDLKRNILLPYGERIPTSTNGTAARPGADAAAIPVAKVSQVAKENTIGSNQAAHPPAASVTKAASVPSAVSSFFTSTKVEKKRTVAEISKTTSDKCTVDKVDVPAVGVTAPAVGVAAPVEDEEEWDDGSGYKPQKSNLSKRSGAKHILEDEDAWTHVPTATAPGDSDTQDAGSASLESQAPVPEETGKGGKRKTPLVTRGAMDDFVNDHTFEGDEAVPPAPERKRKLVEKVWDLYVPMRVVFIP